MTTSYTPGPWEVRTGEAAHACVYQAGTNHNVAVGMRPEDARAIAALPELVEALRLIAAFDASTHTINERANAMIDAVKTARAALAKVEG